MKKAFEYGQRAKSILIRRPQRKIDSTEYGNRIAVCAFAGAVCRLSDFFNSLLEELARLSLNAESEAARIAACKEILDRAYGRAPHPVVTDGDELAEPQIQQTWLDRAKALGLFLAKIEQARALEQQGRQLVGTSAEPDPD